MRTLRSRPRASDPELSCCPLRAVLGDYPLHLKWRVATLAPVLMDGTATFRRANGTEWERNHRELTALLLDRLSGRDPFPGT